MSRAASTPAAPVPHHTLMRAVERALWAPSVHNTQPWRWWVGDDVVELYADRTHHLVGTDPDQRDLVISCGTALHHLQVALHQLGVPTVTERLPDPENRDLLARVQPTSGPIEDRNAGLANAIERRRTDRRAFAGPPQPAQLRRLARHAAWCGAALHPVLGVTAQARLLAILGEASSRQREVPGYPAELAIWTRRYHEAHDGIPPEARTVQFPTHSLRQFPAGHLLAGPRPQTALEDTATLVILTTDGDEPLDWLRAGEATSAVLLVATQLGLASTPLSQATEVDHTRRQLAHTILGVSAHPQIIIRIGLPIDAAELPATPRRPLSSILLPRG